MFISATEPQERQAGKIAFVYLIVSLFCAFFGAVYELFSHEVYSYYMLYAFAVPLAGGTLPFSILSLTGAKRFPGPLCRSLYHWGIATLTIGSIIAGVLEIYGTTNQKIYLYLFAGLSLLLMAVIVYCKPTKQ